MRGRFRSTDVLARLAGDEFAVLLPNAEGHEAMRLADALISRLAADEVASWGVSVSVGVALFGGDEDTNDRRRDGRPPTPLCTARSSVVARWRSRRRHLPRATHIRGPRTGQSSRPPPEPRRSGSQAAARARAIADRQVQAALDADELLIYGQPVDRPTIGAGRTPRTARPHARRVPARSSVPHPSSVPRRKPKGCARRSTTGWCRARSACSQTVPAALAFR